MEKKSKLVLAVLQGSDSDNTIRNLNERGFMVTVLSSTGGFLKKKSTTVMIGVEAGRGPGRPAEVCGTPEGDRVPERDHAPRGDVRGAAGTHGGHGRRCGGVHRVAGRYPQILNPCVSNGKKDLRGSCRAGLFCASKGSSSALSGRLLRVKFCPVPVDLLLIAVRLGKDAAAVLLHIEPQLPGPLVAGPEV